LDAILVTDNQIVFPNTALAIIESNADYKDVFKLKSIIDTIALNRASFNFPVDSLPNLFLGEIEADFIIFENNYIQYVLNKELRPYSNDAVNDKVTLSQLNSNLESLKLQQALYESELEIKKLDLDRNKNFLNNGVISLKEYEDKQLEYLQAERDFKNISVSISQTKQSISTAENKARSTIINSTKEDIILLKRVIQSFNQLKISVRQWELRYVLQSNITGKISFLDYWNKYQSVIQGDLVFIIIPSTNSLYIAKLKSPAHNSGKIEVGQNVNIRLANYPDPEFGILTGTVKNISSSPNKDGMFLIDVILPEKLITSYNMEIVFKQEMGGTAEIITEDLRLIDRFFQQFRKLVNRN